MDIGKNIKRLRQERHISQEALANGLGISRQAVAKWENGTAMPSTANLFALCKMFGVPLDKLTYHGVSPSQKRGGRFSRNILRISLPVSTAVLAIMAAVAFVSGGTGQPPENAIGYGSAQTGIYISGPPVCPYVFAAMAILAAIATVFVFSRHRAGKKRRG